MDTIGRAPKTNSGAHSSWIPILLSRGSFTRSVCRRRGRTTKRSPRWIALFYARRYDASRNALMKTIELAPDFSWAHLRLARVYIQQGRFPEAEAELLKIRASSPGIAGIL